MRYLWILFMVTGVANAARPVSLAKFQPTNADCPSVDGAISHLVTNIGPNVEIVAGRISSSATVLKNLRSVTDGGQLLALSTVFGPGFETNFIKYWTLIKSDCPATRAHLAPALLNTATNPRTLKADREATVATLREDLNKGRYPTYESAAELSSSLATGATKGVWKIAPADLAAFTALNADLKAKNARLTPTFLGYVKTFDSLTPERIAEHPKFREAKKQLATENVEATKALGQLAGIVQRLE